MTHPTYHPTQVLTFEGSTWTVLGHDKGGTRVRLERDDGEVRELARVFVATCLEVERRG